MVVHGPLAGIDLIGASSPECLAVVQYWDPDGRPQTSPVLPGVGGWEVEVERQAGETVWQAENDSLGLAFRLVWTACGSSAALLIPQTGIRESGTCRMKGIRPLPGLIAAHEGDGSTLVLPIDTGCLLRAEGKVPAEHELPVFFPFTYPLMCSMPLWGINCGDGRGIAVVADGGQFDLSLVVRTCWGENKLYAIDPVFALRDYPDDALLAEDITIHYGQLSGTEAGYPGIARFYRRYNVEHRQLPTLAEKMRDNETVAYSAKALCLRCRMGVKQLPTPILEQTPDNQPPLHVYMTFENVRMLVEEMARQQVGPAEICLAGWNYAGHDGAFPQLFPVEEKLGGEAALRSTIARSHELGYPLSLYDNYHDAYSLADTFEPEYLFRRHDGSRNRISDYAGGTAYKLCARTACERYAVESLPRVAELGAKGVYYVDEITLMAPAKCYHPEHPTSRRETVFWWKRIMQQVRAIHGGFQSEGARDWALPELDRAYCVASTPDATGPLIDERVPLFPMVYHGFLIYNCFRSAINSFPGEDIYLRNIAYGGSPIVYYHHLHNPAWSAADGIAKDLTFVDAEKLAVDVARIKHITDDVARLAPLQTSCIEGFATPTPTLSETVYADGTRVLVNYADTPCPIADGHVVPPRNFVVLPA